MLADLQRRFRSLRATEKILIQERISAYENHPAVINAKEQMRSRNSELVVGVCWPIEERGIFSSDSLILNLVITSRGLLIRKDLLLPNPEKAKMGQVTYQARREYCRLDSTSLDQLPGLEKLTELIERSSRQSWGYKDLAIRVLAANAPVLQPGVYALRQDLTW